MKYQAEISSTAVLVPQRNVEEWKIHRTTLTAGRESPFSPPAPDDEKGNCYYSFQSSHLLAACYILREERGVSLMIHKERVLASFVCESIPPHFDSLFSVRRTRGIIHAAVSAFQAVSGGNQRRTGYRVFELSAVV